MLLSKTYPDSTDKSSLSNNMSAPMPPKPTALLDKWTNTRPIWSLSCSQNWPTQAWDSRKHWKSGQRYEPGKHSQKGIYDRKEKRD